MQNTRLKAKRAPCTPRRVLLSVTVFALANGLGSAAQATVGCTVVSELESAEHAPLYASPDAEADITRDIPLNDIVFYPDEDLAPSQAEGWVWVRHDITQQAIWNEGVYGWMKVENIADCG